MDGTVIAALMFPALFVLILVGLPVAFSLIVISFTCGYMIFGAMVPLQLFGRILDVASSFALASVPLFIFMGAMLERSGLAEKLFLAMQLWLGRLRGGFALAAIAVAAVFAASSGIVGAVETVIGMMAIPAMLKARYAKDLISGTICAGGSLGTIIPPSVLGVVYATIAQIPIGDVLAGSMFPGLIMVALFCLYILGRCALAPGDGPKADVEITSMPLSGKLLVTLEALVPASLLIAAVLGTILAGMASPTEAAGMGALGTILLSIAYGRFSFRLLWDVTMTALRINAMILMIVVGGTMFSSIFMLHGGASLVQSIVDYLEVGPAGLIALLLSIVFVMGFVLEWVSILIIVLPIFDALIRAAGIDPLWFGIMMIVVIQTSYLTPPMAPSIFYLKSIAPPEITYRHMFRGVVPFILCQLATLLAVILFPAVATWLPSQMSGF